MGTFVDLREQVKKVLRKINGGTDNDQGWSEGVVQRYQNNTGGVINIGAVVSLYSSSSGLNNGFVINADTEEMEGVIGVVQGTYTGFGPFSGQFERSAPSNNQGVAVMTTGTTYVLTSGTITKGQYAYVSSTDGLAKAKSTRTRGAFGTYVSNGSNSAYVRLPLSSTFTGSEVISQYQTQYVTDLATLDFASPFAIRANAGATIGAVDMKYDEFELDAVQVKVANSSNYFTANSPATGIETLRPTSDVVSSGTIVYSSGSTGWNLVDESVLDTADYYAGSNDGVTAWYMIHGIAATALTSSKRITSVTLNINVNKSLGGTAGYFYVRDPQTGDIYTTVGLDGSGGPILRSATFTTRPWDGRAWTVDDCRHLQMGAAQDAAGNNLKVHQVYVEINYSIPVTVEQALTQLGAGGGGGGGSHTILSATHTDTLAGTVVRGDQMVGNSTPKWGRVPIAGSAPSNAAWISDGTDARWEWPAPVKTITSSSSNVFWGQVDFRAGSGVALAASSNTITISSSAGAGGGGGSPLTVTEVDGSPSVASVTTIKFPNDSVTDNGSGTVTIRDIPQAFIGARAYHNTTQTVGTGAAITAALNSERYDTDAFHDNTTNNSRMTIPAGLGGKYLIGYSFEAASVADAGEMYGEVYLNGATVIQAEQRAIAASKAANFTGNVIYDLAAGDYVQLRIVSVTTANTRTINSSANYSPEFWVAKLDSGKVGSGIGAKAYNSTTQTVNNTTASLTLDSEEFDTDGFHSTSSNTERMTVPTGLGGKYLIAYHLHVPPTTVANPQSIGWLRKNGSTTLRGSSLGTNIPVSANDLESFDDTATVIADLAAGDYVDIQFFTNDNLAIGHATGEYATSLSIMRLDSGTSAYTGPRWGSGTAFPSGPATNDRFTRTDLGLDFYWDGTQWVTTHLYHETFGNSPEVSTIVEAYTVGMDGLLVGSIALFQPTYSILVVGVYFNYRIQTTNNGSNYWTLTVDCNGAPTIVKSTAADAINTTYNVYVASGVATTTQGFARFYAAKTGTPGSFLFMKAALVYRIIAT